MFLIKHKLLDCTSLLIWADFFCHLFARHTPNSWSMNNVEVGSNSLPVILYFIHLKLQVYHDFMTRAIINLNFQVKVHFSRIYLPD